MGKHNGKARKTGITVGSALVNRAKREGRAGTASAYLHTTEPVDKGPNMQSVIESNDLDEMMEMVRAGPHGRWQRRDSSFLCTHHTTGCAYFTAPYPLLPHTHTV